MCSFYQKYTVMLILDWWYPSEWTRAFFLKPVIPEGGTMGSNKDRTTKTLQWAMKDYLALTHSAIKLVTSVRRLKSCHHKDKVSFIDRLHPGFRRLYKMLHYALSYALYFVLHYALHYSLHYALQYHINHILTSCGAYLLPVSSIWPFFITCPRPEKIF